MNKPGRFISLFDKKYGLFYLIGGIVSLGVYLSVSSLYYRVGFPLDDAWIHQTYARNIAQGLGWTFMPGKTSGGSTSPLWTMLITLGYLFHIAPLIWNTFIGGLLLMGCILVMRSYLLKYCPPGLSNGLALLFLFEWHYVWAALSGMETMLSIALVTFLFFWLETEGDRGWQWGLFLGICVWVRPDLITLIIPIAGKLFLSKGWKGLQKHSLLPIIKKGLGLMFILSLLGLSYFWFNRTTSGSWLTTTFYAKQAEYASLRTIPYWIRYFNLLSLSWVGVGAILLPGFLVGIYQALRTSDWVTLAFAFWYFFYIGIYAMNLPVTYQHGRYVQPAMAVFYLIGLKGAVLCWGVFSKPSKWAWIVNSAWKSSIVLVGMIFYCLGAVAYAKDVAFIESQMVDTALWVKANVPSTTEIAVHDIGAMGYYGERDMVDLAGLINPSVIPFIRDEERLGEYLSQEEIEVLVCFPGWYPLLTAHRPILYQGYNRFGQESGLGPLTVYHWSSDKILSP